MSSTHGARPHPSSTCLLQQLSHPQTETQKSGAGSSGDRKACYVSWISAQPYGDSWPASPVRRFLLPSPPTALYIQIRPKITGNTHTNLWLVGFQGNDLFWRPVSTKLPNWPIKMAAFFAIVALNILKIYTNWYKAEKMQHNHLRCQVGLIKANVLQTYNNGDTCKNKCMA